MTVADTSEKNGSITKFVTLRVVRVAVRFREYDGVHIRHIRDGVRVAVDDNDFTIEKEEEDDLSGDDDRAMDIDRETQLVVNAIEIDFDLVRDWGGTTSTVSPKYAKYLHIHKKIKKIIKKRDV